MVSRRTILALSILFSACVFITLLVLAPRIVLMQANASVREIEQLFRVKLVEEPAPPVFRTETSPDGETAPGNGSARGPAQEVPASLEQLLRTAHEAINPFTNGQQKGTDVPQLAERAAADSAAAREPGAPPPPDIMEKVDAQIIEIAANDSRRDLDIPRRLVRPSNTRIIQEGEFPTLREPGASDEPLILPPTLAADGGIGDNLAKAIENTTQKADEGGPPKEASPKPNGPLPDFAAEQQVARAPVLTEVRKESKYDFLDDLVDIKVDTYCPPGEKQGYFRLQIVPKAGKDIPVLPKDITFTVDASHSITQQKLERTIKGTQVMVDRLREGDQFNIVIFRDKPALFSPQPAPATPENKTAAKQFLASIQASGETDVYEGIRPVITARPRPGAAGVVLVVTDGRPTTGVKDSRTIINALSAENAQTNSVFAYGGGKLVNHYMLDLLAYRNKGEAFVSPTIASMDKDLPAFFDNMSDPILVDLKTEYGQIAADTIFPREMPDFFKGRAVTVYGRFDPATDKELSMRLAGTAASKKKEVIFKTDLKAAAGGDEVIARSWAFQKIYYLIGEICRVGETPELLAQLNELSKKYGIETSYGQ